MVRCDHLHSDGERSMITDGYVFPAHKSAKNTTTFSLVTEKLFEEFKEAQEAACIYNANWSPTPRLNLAMELIDVIHVCETAMRSMDISDSEYSKIRTMVYLKNDLRGYYDEES